MSPTPPHQSPLESLLDLRAALAAAPRICVAYSGGLDSSVLLHLASQQCPPSTALRALHINHQLQAEADDWQAHCAARSGELSVPFTALRVAAQAASGDSPEATARSARREAFARELGEGELLLLAQHADDQIETLLLMLLRGSGPAGLASMPARAPLGSGQLWRPLLGIGRAQILDYAQRHQLGWVEDPSNALPDFERNYLRHQVLPALRSGPRGAALGNSVARSARLCAEADELMGELAQIDLATAERGERLSVAALRELSAARCRNLLRYWISGRALPTPSAAQLQRVLDEVLEARPDAECRVHWPGAELRRYRERLYLMPPLGAPPLGRTHWADRHQPLCIPGLEGSLAPALLAGLRLPVGARLEIGFRQGGERLRVIGNGQVGATGRAMTRSLKKLLQESGLPPWQRCHVPLLFVAGELVAALGVVLGSDYIETNKNT